MYCIVLQGCSWRLENKMTTTQPWLCCVSMPPQLIRYGRTRNRQNMNSGTCIHKKITKWLSPNLTVAAGVFITGTNDRIVLFFQFQYVNCHVVCIFYRMILYKTMAVHETQNFLVRINLSCGSGALWRWARIKKLLSRPRNYYQVTYIHKLKVEGVILNCRT